MTDEPGGLTIGGPAPDFTLRDQFGQDVTLSSFAGHKAVLLVFYPYAFSNVCTGEMSQIRARLDEFMTFDAEVLAISCDPTPRCGRSPTTTGSTSRCSRTSGRTAR